MKEELQEYIPYKEILKPHRINRKPESKLTDNFLYAVGDYASTIIKNDGVPTNKTLLHELLIGAVTQALKECLEKRPDHYTCEKFTGILMNDHSQFKTVCLISGLDPDNLGADNNLEHSMPTITESMFIKMVRRKMEMKYGVDLKSGYLRAGFGKPEYFSLLNEYHGFVGFVKYKPNNARYSDHLAVHVNDAVWRMNNYEGYNDVTVTKFVVIGEGYNACRMYDAAYGDILSSQGVSLYLFSRDRGLRKLN